jgi:curved DNA-binding protein CbpA
VKSFRQFLKEQMSPKEAEAILGLSSGYDANEVQRAYKYQAKINHPDRGGDAEKMKLVNQAYAVLKGKSSALDRRKEDEQRRQEYDRRQREVQGVMQAAIRKAFKPSAFIKHFETHMGGEKFTWTETADLTKTKYTFVWAGFRGEFRGNKGSVFEFDVYANPQDVMGGSSGLGSTLSNISFPLKTTSYGFVNNRKAKMFQRDWGATRVHDVLFKPEIAFPPKSLKRTETAASRPLKRSDMQLGLSKRVGAISVNDMWFIPLKDGTFIGASRVVFMKTPTWTVYDVYDKTGISYKPRRLGLALYLPEDDATLNLFISLTKMDSNTAVSTIRKMKESRK